MRAIREATNLQLNVFFNINRNQLMKATSVWLSLLNGVITGTMLLPLTAMLLWIGSAKAQVTPDYTLNTSVSQNSNNFTITNGHQVGNNLFHSFSQFSIPTNGSAFFNNTPDVQNIFSRVTGNNVSNIDGLIRANGSTNLFLLNPNGIIFGSNARLNIGGSFVVSTAESLLFDNGFAFSATSPQTPPLLTLNVPVGLQFGSNPGLIAVQGTGHNAQLSGTDRISELNVGSSGLQVQPGKTLALIGGHLNLDGGLLFAPGGRIELGSVTRESVALNSHPQGFTLSYPHNTTFGNIQMSQLALASASGTSAGSIQIQGQQVDIRDGSMVLVQNQGDRIAGDITINATESLHLVDKSPDFRSSSSLINETTSSGAAGNIVITTPQLLLDKGAFILNRSFHEAPGGNIVVNADEMQIGGFTLGDPNPFRAVSLLLASAHASGKGGNVSISTENLSILDGGNVGARPYGQGNGGDVTVKADTIQVTSLGAPTGSYFSLLSTATFGSGNAGNLTIDTRTLSVQNGGRVSASSISRGSSGNLTVNASKSIEVIGVKDAQNPTYIGAAVRVFGNQGSSANSGITTINTPVLNVSDGATVFVLNQGNGNAGSLRINTDTLRLNNGGSISASTKAGEGGNIDLNISDITLMRHHSSISAEAGGTGNGGNITLNSPIIMGLGNSDIIANAVQGYGGNIQIATGGIFGLRFRPQPTTENDITASSQFGVNGTVQINTIGVDPNSGLVKLPTNVVDSSEQIATGCAEDGDSYFVATGRGGIPQNPIVQIIDERAWEDVRDLSTYYKTLEVQAHTPPSTNVLVQATTWYRNAVGKVELIASQSSAHVESPLTCAAIPRVN
ncbi:MAG: S-layer family protein [Scytonema sp. PMC 1069.18]|nr:S-layer family protein [Scytonema sp. PMC 1069.18]MEC4880278.1 S-layer family protein [Scytonema sp. PMC 1070.18]